MIEREDSELNQVETISSTFLTVEDSAKEKDNKITISMSLNEEMDGIELTFGDKPDADVIAQLKANGFRWSKRGGFWYAKQTAERLAFANSLVSECENNSEAEIKPVSLPSYPVIDIDDIHTYVIDEKLQQAEHSANWIFRKDEIDRTKEIQEVFGSWNEQVKIALATTDNQHIIYGLQKTLQRFKKKYFEAYVSLLRHKANNPHIAVTGRGNINVSRYNKAQDRQDKLIGGIVELDKWMERQLSKAYHEIRQEKEAKMREQMNKVDVALTFKTETRQITTHGLTEKVRAYLHGDYMIAKSWGCFRVFKDGKEVHKMKSTDKLHDAKKYVALLVSGQLSA